MFNSDGIKITTYVCKTNLPDLLRETSSARIGLMLGVHIVCVLSKCVDLSSRDLDWAGLSCMIHSPAGLWLSASFKLISLSIMHKCKWANASENSSKYLFLHSTQESHMNLVWQGTWWQLFYLFFPQEELFLEAPLAQNSRKNIQWQFLLLMTSNGSMIDPCGVPTNAIESASCAGLRSHLPPHKPLITLKKHNLFDILCC